MAFRKRQVTINKTLIERGKWYQPYIHSVPKNFNKAQAAYYGDFSLKAYESSLKDIVGNLTTTLINYYKNREKELKAYMFGTENVSDEQTNELLTDFLQNFAQQYAENRANKYPLLDNIANSLYNVQQMQKNFGGLTKKAVEAMAKRVVDNMGKSSKLTADKKKSIKKELMTVVTAVNDFLFAIMKKYGIKNPNDLIGEMMDKLLRGQSIQGDITEVLKTKNILEKELKMVQELVKAIEKGVISSKYSSVRQSSIGKELGKAFGLFNELIVTEAAAEYAVGAIDEISSQFGRTMESITVLDTGKKDVKSDVSDGKVVMQVKGEEPFDIGIDVKYHFARYKNSMRTYRRGLNQKKVNEVFNFMKPTDVKIMVYLLVNSYYFKEDSTVDFYDRFMNRRSQDSLYGLLKIFSALYAALPSKMGSDVPLSNLATEIKTDTRAIVAIDGIFILMTTFLENIEEQITKGGSASKTSLTDLDTFITTVLDGWNSAEGITGGKESKLYKKKIDHLLSKEKIASNKGYNILKAEITNKITGTELLEWTYKSKHTFRF